MSNNTKNDIEILEAPYKLPEGWKWVRLGDFIDIYRGVSYKKTDAHSEKQQNDCLIMRGGNIEEGNINIDADNVYVDKSIVAESQFIKKNDVIIVTSTGSTKVIGRAGISNDNYSDVAFGAFLTLARPNGKADKSFVNHYFQSSLYRERIRQLASGVNINNIRTDYITESPFPLPPNIEEQQRIVNRIESMFAKLDEAKEKAQNVVDSFETRKAAILHQAFTGNLTAKWRKENGVSDDSWIEKKLEDVCEFITKGTTPKKEDMTIGFGDIPYIKVYNLCFDTALDFTVDPTFVKKETHENFLARSITLPGDVLMNIVGPPFGKVSIVPDDYPEWNINQAIARFRCKEELLNIYLSNYLISPRTIENMSRQIKTTAGQQNLTLEICRNISIFVPSISEQQEIVHILDNVLEKERTAKSAAEQVLEQIDLLKKSILARAFRGEL